MLEINGLDNAFGFNASDPIPSLYDQIRQVLRGMLRTTLSYAKDIPTAVYVYIQYDNQEIKIDTLYRINGKLYEAHELNLSKVNENFDTSKERQQALYNFLTKDTAESLIPLYTKNALRIPNQIWTEFNLLTNEQHTEFGYNIEKENPDIKTALKDWKTKINTPTALNTAYGYEVETSEIGLIN